jgi:NAD+ diphosphatase
MDGHGAAGVRPAYLSSLALRDRDPSPERPIYLGVTDDVPYFTADLDDEQARTASERSQTGGAPAATFAELRAAAAQLTAFDAALLAYARAMVWWNEQHRFCAVCGSETERREAGHLRVCTACETSHFPRTDPAVIVLVTHGDACLLGNNAASAPDRYSTLAGFVEPGESLEDAVRREIHEEAGVTLTTVRYHSSQPWPFPASLMVGFTAEARDRTIHANSDELRDARWFTRAELRAAVESGTVQLSSPISIARRLIDEWRSAGTTAG